MLALGHRVDDAEHRGARGKAALQRAIDCGEMLERCERHQHSRDEGSKTTHGHLAIARLRQRDHDDHGHRE